MAERGDYSNAPSGTRMTAIAWLACAKQQPTYRDPATGYAVFTAREPKKGALWLWLSPLPLRSERVFDCSTICWQTWIEINAPSSQSCDVLSWSGGKDSFLALVALARESERDVVLLTTYDGRSGQVAHQEVHIDDVRQQAKDLELNLLLVPLYPETNYLDRLELGLRLQQVRRPIHRVVFGDLHLEHVRSWRETHLGPALLQLGLRAHFPLWQRPYPELRNDFFNSGAAAVISAVASEHLEGTQIGQEFTLEADHLPENVDQFGENGEYHTLVCPPDGGWRLLGKPIRMIAQWRMGPAQHCCCFCQHMLQLRRR